MPTNRRFTSAQQDVLAQYGRERRLGLDSYTAARMVVGAFADDIAATIVHGGTPSRAAKDRYRVATQWHMQVVARPLRRSVLELVRTLSDANRQTVAS